MKKYLELLKELKKLGEELIDNEQATNEVENMDCHLEIAINIIEEEMKEN